MAHDQPSHPLPASPSPHSATAAISTRVISRSPASRSLLDYLPGSITPPRLFCTSRYIDLIGTRRVSPHPTYTLYDGEVLDLSPLDGEQRDYLDAAYELAWPAIGAEEVAASRKRVDWVAFNAWLSTAKNPVLRATNGFVTREIWNHPLYRALHDLDARLGMRQGAIKRPRGNRWLEDPFADEFVPVSEIAKRKSVTVKAVHKAIERGDLVAVVGELGGPGPKNGLLVSRRSAKAWKPRRSAA